MSWSTRTARALALVPLLGVLPACGRLSDAEAEALVRRYDERLVEAYRLGDVRLVEPVVGPGQARRLAGLIGVKLDEGLTLDARLDAFALRGVEREKDEVVVRTEERWTYRDRAVGSGAQVGEASRDRYDMRYHLRRLEGRWVVDRIAFDAEPVVGRRTGDTP
jgi:hypothetical protein